MKKQAPKENFPPLDDLYVCLQEIEMLLKVNLTEGHFKVGRQQLFAIFLHETLHGFITAKAGWIWDLQEEERDFVDEVVVRIVMDSIINKLSYSEKVNPYYKDHIKHDEDLPKYGFNLSKEEYHKIENTWLAKYYDKWEIQDFCKTVLEYYRFNKKQLKL